MLGDIAVKHIPMAAKRSPARKEKGIINNEEGKSIIPKIAKIGSIIIVFITLLVAPQRSSPAITSSMERGVAIMASKVFW